jgi:hypothetical protein
LTKGLARNALDLKTHRSGPRGHLLATCVLAARPSPHRSGDHECTRGGAARSPRRNGLFGDLKALDPEASTAQLWDMVGETPMIGQNDTPDEILFFPGALVQKLYQFSSMVEAR